MIHIQRGQPNNICLTLKEKTTLDIPTYLFVFTNDMTGESKAFISADVTTYTDTYSEFVVTESDTEDVLNGTVTLSPAGFWTYTVYEQESTTNLDHTLATGIVETGRVKVTGNEFTTYTVDENGTVTSI